MRTLDLGKYPQYRKLVRVREYADRGMLKWQGYVLSEHSDQGRDDAIANYDKQSAERFKLTELDQEEIDAALLQAAFTHSVISVITPDLISHEGSVVSISPTGIRIQAVSGRSTFIPRDEIWKVIQYGRID